MAETDRQRTSDQGQGVQSCRVCGCRELFIRKDFPQKVGLAIVTTAAVAFLVLAARPRTFYLGVIVLLVATAIDAVLYLIVGRVTVCYRCRAEFRDAPINPKHQGFDLATAEKYRNVAPPDEPPAKNDQPEKQTATTNDE